MGWVDVGDGCSATVRGTGRGAELVCRNARGRELARVPAGLKKAPGITALVELGRLLAEHERRAHARIERWMLGSPPVPTALLAALWPDPVWRAALTGLVLAPDTGGAPAADRAAGAGVPIAPRTREAVLDEEAGAVPGPPQGDGEDALIACRYTHPALDGPLVATAARAAGSAVKAPAGPGRPCSARPSSAPRGSPPRPR
ncbi:DUF4132 domain-containing protein [Nocardiopsis potens]|uniref:DUF4132 domain-containing protein n=1 Tax=Nocardiopsis potens TaxID=1246458 RepID=UPI0003493A3C|nr:DUF4132 domain-containing protein [Nocardiopsis potens]